MTPLLLFALQRLGAILVPVNYRLAPPEVQSVVLDAEPSLLIVDEAMFVGEEWRDWLRTCNVPCLALRGEGALSAVDEQSCDPDLAPPFAGRFDDPCMILYTSGTTGVMKGVEITSAMLFGTRSTRRCALSCSPGRIVNFLPLFHTGAWNVLASPVIHHGGTVVLMRKFDAEAVLSCCESEGVTVLFRRADDTGDDGED